jgi:hypothetical protein
VDTDFGAFSESQRIGIVTAVGLRRPLYGRVLLCCAVGLPRLDLVPSGSLQGPGSIPNSPGDIKDLN